MISERIKHEILKCVRDYEIDTVMVAWQKLKYDFDKDSIYEAWDWAEEKRFIDDNEFRIYFLTAEGLKEFWKMNKEQLDKMPDGEKVHRLLEFMWTTNPNKYDWNISELIPAFADWQNEYVIKHLCKILIDNNDVNNLQTKDSFSIGFNENSKIAYHSNKYSKTSISVKPQVTIGAIQQNYGTVHGAMTQSSDSSSNKSISPRPTNKKSILKTIGIIIGAIVGLVSIAYYVMEIMAKK